MKIAYISNENPLDINVWSGTPFHIFSTLAKKHKIKWVGGGLLQGAQWHHLFLQKKNMYLPHDYSDSISTIISKQINNDNFDIVLSSNYLLCNNLDIDIPVVFFNDVVYGICEGFFFAPNQLLKEKSTKLERRCLQRADRIVYSSEFTKLRAIQDHDLQGEKIAVIDFGANIPTPKKWMPANDNMDKCNILFVGRNWVKKGGPKVLDAYRILKNNGFPCQLTIIGSRPSEQIYDEDIHVIPWLDKSKAGELEQYQNILQNSHFMVLPTVFDAYGIVFCEASAYGVPSIAANVGGVGQPVKEGVNGFLMTPDAKADDYAKIIRSIFEDKERYRKLRLSSRMEYETRLNWDKWAESVTCIMSELIKKNKEKKNDIKRVGSNTEYFLPVYAFNLEERKDRLNNLKKQFEGKPEFDVTYMKAVKHKIGAVGLWRSICNAVKLAKKRNEDIIVLCEDDHEFTSAYSKEYLIKNIIGAYRQGSELLNGGTSGFGTAIPISLNRSCVDWFYATQFIIIFKPLFNKILEYDFKDSDAADCILSKIAENPQVMYPPISKQGDFGYSDIWNHENQSVFLKAIFNNANARLGHIHKVYQSFITGSSRTNEANY